MRRFDGHASSHHRCHSGSSRRLRDRAFARGLNGRQPAEESRIFASDRSLTDPWVNRPISAYASAGRFVIRCRSRTCVSLFLGSSAVEHSTVNRMVAGSNPARGAKTSPKILPIRPRGSHLRSRRSADFSLATDTLPIGPTSERPECCRASRSGSGAPLQSARRLRHDRAPTSLRLVRNISRRKSEPPCTIHAAQRLGGYPQKLPA
jgi:hypothetical protein